MIIKTTNHIEHLALKHKKKQIYLSILIIDTFTTNKDGQLYKERIKQTIQWSKIKTGWEQKSIQYPEDITNYIILAMGSLELDKINNH